MFFRKEMAQQHPHMNTQGIPQAMDYMGCIQIFTVIFIEPKRLYKTFAQY